MKDLFMGLATFIIFADLGMSIYALFWNKKYNRVVIDSKSLVAQVNNNFHLVVRKTDLDAFDTQSVNLKCKNLKPRFVTGFSIVGARKWGE